MGYWSNVHNWATSVYGDLEGYWTHWMPHHPHTTVESGASTSAFSTTSDTDTAWTSVATTTASTTGITSAPFTATTTVVTSTAFTSSSELSTLSSETLHATELVPSNPPSLDAVSSLAAPDVVTSTLSTLDEEFLSSTFPTEIPSSSTLPEIESNTAGVHTVSQTSTPPLPPSTASPVTMPYASDSRHDEFSAGTVLLIFGCGVLAAILVYLLTPCVLRLGLFVYNASKLLFRSKNSFSEDSRMGLTSETFDLTSNVAGDEREGLSRRSKLRVLFYMLIYGETFDEARFRLVRYQFAQNGIAPDGQPLDPKFVKYEA